MTERKAITEKIRCPKCGHQQSNEVECAACGLIFARYRQQQAKLAASASSVRPAAQPVLLSMGRLLGLVALIFCTALITWYFTARHDAGNPPSAPASPADEALTDRSIELKNIPSVPPAVNRQTSATAASIVQAGNPLDNARRATVTVKTPWGTGSGFFVTDSYIVTNRHVVGVRPEQVAELRRLVENARQQLTLREASLAEFRQKTQLAGGATGKLLRAEAERYEAELEKAKENLARAEEQLNKMESGGLRASEIAIIMADNSEYTANDLTLSDEKDLALITLYANHPARLRPPPGVSPIQPGDTLYAIGSPSGLPQTVTKGILSGYQRYPGPGGADGQVYIQTDAAINPGNSGGPLIDDKGYVRGVNTMILRNTQGIGFAIPIEDVYREFDIMLR